MQVNGEALTNLTWVGPGICKLCVNGKTDLSLAFIHIEEVHTDCENLFALG